MSPRHCRRHGRKRCPECGSRAVLVRYEKVAGVAATGLAVIDPVQVRCTNKGCVKYWR
jgi:hypothetical protein